MSEPRAGSQRHVVTKERAGQRLDRWLADRAQVGRREAQRWIEERRVTVDGRRVAKSHLVEEGETVEFAPPGPVLVPEPDAVLDVVWQSPEAIVVAKPAGQPCAALRPGESGTLAAALAGHFPELTSLGRKPGEAGLVHRLDNDTAGLVLVARNEAALERLVGALEREAIDKRYLALVENRGRELPSVIDAALGPDRKNPRRVRIAKPSDRHGRPSRTTLSVIERTEQLLLVEAKASRAYRHQIRAHLAHVGAPLIGDTLYGGRPWAPFEGRHALFAHYMAWAGDDTLPGFRVRLDLPEEFRLLLEAPGDAG